MLEDVLALTVSIILTPADVITHTQDFPLELVQFVELRCNGWNRGRFSYAAMGISHEGTTGRRSMRRTVHHKALLIYLLVVMGLHSMITEIFSHSVLVEHHDEGA